MSGKAAIIVWPAPVAMTTSPTMDSHRALNSKQGHMHEQHVISDKPFPLPNIDLLLIYRNYYVVYNFCYIAIAHTWHTGGLGSVKLVLSASTPIPIWVAHTPQCTGDSVELCIELIQVFDQCGSDCCSDSQFCQRVAQWLVQRWHRLLHWRWKRIQSYPEVG